MAQISTYLALIPSANAGKPKFIAFISALVSPFVDLINFYESMPSAFALGMASGAQLTTIGLWVGVSRFVSTSIQAWFSFDTANVGWDQGVWWEPFQSTTGTTLLDDTTMLALIRAKILWNVWNGTTPALYAILTGLFPYSTVSIVDNLNYTLSVSIAAGLSGYGIGGYGAGGYGSSTSGVAPNATLKAMATGGQLPYSPIGVAVTYTFS
jgi:hypothetical protein